MQDDDSLPRRTFLRATGGTAAAAAVAGCLGDGDDGESGDGSDGSDGGSDGSGDGDGDGGNESDGGDGQEEPDSYAPKAQEAWETIVNNPEPDAEQTRKEAFVEMEEAVRDDMILLPLYHRLGERFWYDRVDIPKIGPLGGHRQQHDNVQVEGSDTLNLRNATISSLDPIQSTDTASATIINDVYENLVHYPNAETELENQLVEEVEISDDLLTYTFSIKQGVQYHDGRELTAADFKYAWRRLVESENSQRANFAIGPTFLGMEHETDENEGVGVANVVPDSIGVEVVDDYTLEMTLQSPQPAALDILAYDSFAAVPEGFVGDIPGYDGEVSQDEFSTEVMNGTGPFEFDTWVPDSEAQVVRFNDHWSDGANVEAVHWQIIEDDNARWTAINEGNLDVFGIPTAFYEPGNVDAEQDDQGRRVGTYGPLENDETVNYLGVAELTTFYVAWNASNVPRPVRRAIAYVTDHQELIDQVFKGRGAPAFSFTPPGMWRGELEDVTAYDTWVENWPYSPNETDVEGARQVLEEAGHTSDDPFEMTLTTYESEVFQEFGRLTRDKVSGIGIELTLEQAPFNTLISRGQDGDLEFYSLGWIWSWVDPAYGLYGFEPENTNTSQMPGDANGYYLDWQAGLEGSEE